MSLIVNPSAAYNWTLKREQLALKGLQKVGAVGAGETASAEDMALAIEALEGILKNLLVYGHTWPKTLSNSATIAFTTGLASKALPADFYKFIALNWVDSSGNENPVTMMTTMQYATLVNKAQQGANPIQGYIDNFNVLWLWPVPNTAVNLKLYYQQVILNTVAQSAIDLDAQWNLAIPYGIACEIADEFEKSDAKIQRLETKWAYMRNLCIMAEAPNSPNQMEVVD